MNTVTRGESIRDSEVNCRAGSENSEAFSCNSVGKKTTTTTKKNDVSHHPKLDGPKRSRSQPHAETQKLKGCELFWFKVRPNPLPASFYAVPFSPSLERFLPRVCKALKRYHFFPASRCILHHRALKGRPGAG